MNVYENKIEGIQASRCTFLYNTAYTVNTKMRTPGSTTSRYRAWLARFASFRNSAFHLFLGRAIIVWPLTAGVPIPNYFSQSACTLIIRSLQLLLHCTIISQCQHFSLQFNMHNWMTTLLWFPVKCPYMFRRTNAIIRELICIIRRIMEFRTI
jgi:hypothetical protein